MSNKLRRGGSIKRQWLWQGPFHAWYSLPVFSLAKGLQLHVILEISETCYSGDLQFYNTVKVYLYQSSTKFIPCQTLSPNVIGLTGRSPNVYRYFWSLLPCKIFLNKALSIEVKWGIIRFISSGILGPTNKLSSIIGRPELARSRAILYVTLDPDFPWLRMFLDSGQNPEK